MIRYLFQDRRNAMQCNDGQIPTTKSLYLTLPYLIPFENPRGIPSSLLQLQRQILGTFIKRASMIIIPYLNLFISKTQEESTPCFN